MIKEYFALLCIHWIADFVAQTHWQASNKSKNWNALFRHVSSYTLILILFSFAIFQSINTVLIFGIINGILHFATDGVTSRMTAYLWAEKRIHDFFVVIGFDQLIHQGILLITMIWIFS